MNPAINMEIMKAVGETCCKLKVKSKEQIYELRDELVEQKLFMGMA